MAAETKPAVHLRDAPADIVEKTNRIYPLFKRASLALAGTITAVAVSFMYLI